MVWRFQTGKKNFFFENCNWETVNLIETGLLLQEKCWFVAGICLIWKLMGYTNDHRMDAPIICKF